MVNGLEDADDRANEARKILEMGFSQRGGSAARCSRPRTWSGYAKVFGGEKRSVMS
ncbi:MAG: hypothetical protein MZV49_26250 [Rhodopseudomonas palustris]|nr:hypothetical protein [Rhodopseudomonas palustris]